jgi:cell division protein FtsW
VSAPPLERRRAREVTRVELQAQLLVLVTLGLVAFGLVMVYSATSAPAAIGHGDPSSYLKRQGTYALLGVVALIGVSRIDYRALRRLAPALLLASFLGCVAVLGVGTQVNGARRWLSFGPAVFQPSELAKLALALWTASYLAKARAPRTLGELARPLGIVAGVVCLVILVEPDLGTVIAIVLMLIAMLAVSGTTGGLLARASGLVVALGAAAVWFEPYRRARLLSFLNPWHDAQGAGFQNVQAMIGLGAGGLFGVGLGQGIQKVNYLPEAHTDMILAVIGEELGLVGVAAVIAAYAVFAYTALSIALRCTDPFGKRLAAGIGTLICAQAAVNIGTVLGVAPLTGIPLPFISYGGSNLVVALASVGILLNIASHGAEARRRVPDRGRGNRRPRPAVARGGRSAAGARRDRDVRRVAESHRSAARS